MPRRGVDSRDGESKNTGMYAPDGDSEKLIGQATSVIARRK